VNMGDLIPTLRKINLHIENTRPEHLTRHQLKVVFHLVDEILEQARPATLEEKREFESYRNCFIRKRLLASWKKWRTRISCTARLDERRRKQIIGEVFAELKPLLYRSIQECTGKQEEDITPLTLSVFLWNQEYITRRFGLSGDSRCWREILELVDELPESVLRIL
jgi:hypothetical protein